MNGKFLVNYAKSTGSKPQPFANPNWSRFDTYFLARYAVYGATVSTEYYIYSSDSEETNHDMDSSQRYYNENSDSTTWTWSIDVNTTQSVMGQSKCFSLTEGTLVYISNAAGYYSHPSLAIQMRQTFLAR